MAFACAITGGHGSTVRAYHTTAWIDLEPTAYNPKTNGKFLRETYSHPTVVPRGRAVSVVLPSDRPLKVEECDQAYVTIDFGAFDSAELLVVSKPEDLPPVDEDDPLHPFFHVTEDYFRTLELRGRINATLFPPEGRPPYDEIALVPREVFLYGHSDVPPNVVIDIARNPLYQFFNAVAGGTRAAPALPPSHWTKHPATEVIQERWRKVPGLSPHQMRQDIAVVTLVADTAHLPSHCGKMDPLPTWLTLLFNEVRPLVLFRLCAEHLRDLLPEEQRNELDDWMVEVDFPPRRLNQSIPGPLLTDISRHQLDTSRSEFTHGSARVLQQRTRHLSALLAKLARATTIYHQKPASGNTRPQREDAGRAI